LAGCPQVTDVCEQPLKVWYAWRETERGLHVRLLDERPQARSFGRDRISYIVPDFHVAMQNGAAHLIEVKVARKLGDPIVQRKTCVARLYALYSGRTFHVLTEHELLCGPLLRLLSLIARFRAIQSDTSLCSIIRQNVSRSGTTIGDLIEHTCGEESVVRLHIYHMLAVDALSFDPQVNVWGNEILVFPKGDITWDPFDSVWASSSCWTVAPIDWSASSPMTALFPKM
jgi:hypothetical protein